MSVDRFSFTMDSQLGQAVRDAAAQSKVSVSRWLSDAAADRLRNQLLGMALDRWEAEHGALTEAELADAEGRLNLSGAARISPQDQRGTAQDVR